ncbi:MAG TPA: tetratricopeptide repeat protein [Burkholderiaceae bacterium]|nr:tetratricopeptide repeat protein [Burkholderiaceae bacterium]
MRTPWPRLGATLVAAGALLLGAGCATAPEDPPAAYERFFADAAFAAPARPVDAAEVFALSPAMDRYLKVEIAPLLRQMGRQRGLVEALHSRAHLRLEYDNAVTRNAAEAFDVRAGNCLSLVVMTAALAKALDLPISYQALVGHDSWSRSGALTFINGHVNIAIARRLIDRVEGIETDSVRLSFGSPGAGRGAALRNVDERTIVAMFMNNRAAEALLREDADQAYAYAREAVRQDPRFAGALNTLGVIYRQRGLAAAAEGAWRHALALETEQRAALSNLALLYESQGRAAEAAPLRRALARLEAEPPFQQFDLGREAIARGDFAAARAHIEREMKRDPDYHEFHYWLAIALAGLGDTRGAQDHLARARDNSTTREDQALYAGKLEKLKRLVQ